MKLLTPALYERLGREIVVLSVCYLIAQTINVLAILFYRTDWRELYTQTGWVIILTGSFYFVSIVLRLIVPRLLRRGVR